MIAEYTNRETLEQECSFLSDKSLNDLYKEARKLDNNLYVKEFNWLTKKFNWKNPFKPKHVNWTEYEVKYYLGGQAQIICFKHSDAKSIETVHLLQYVALDAFLYGFIKGIRSSELNKSKEE